MSLQACADIVQRGDPDRFLAAMAAPQAARAVLFPLYAFNVEVARAPWVTQEPMIAEMRLQWWRDALEEIATGAPVRRHEVGTPLSGILDAEGARILDRLIEARRWDIDGGGFPDDGALSRHLDDTAGGLMWASARALGADAGIEATVRDFAWGAGLSAWFRAVPEFAARGRRPLPDPAPAAIAQLAEEGLRRIARSRQTRGTVPRQITPALFAGWPGRPLLRQAATEPGRVVEGSLSMSEFARRTRVLGLALTGRW